MFNFMPNSLNRWLPFHSTSHLMIALWSTHTRASMFLAVIVELVAANVFAKHRGIPSSQSYPTTPPLHSMFR